jgi:hypothetical protein
MHHLACSVMQDHTRTQKPDARNDALDDSACISIGIFRYG